MFDNIQKQGKMPRDAMIALRLPKEILEELKLAAAADDRSASSMALRFITQGLAARKVFA